MIFSLCNVLTALDPRFERLLCEDFNGGLCVKGGVNTRQDIYIRKIES
jgi:hypothetical protein